jgi:hypothetical protein
MSEEKEIEKRPNLEGFAASVELPEGHQLVLGELPPGTVVEVATWQGTGRPDETTNRFLLSASGPGLQRRQRREENSATQTPQVEGEKSLPVLETPKSEFISQPSLGSVGASSGYLGLRTAGVDSSTTAAPSSVKVQSSSRWRTLGRSLFSVVAVIAISAMTLSLFGISATVPTRGADTTFGPSTSSLVIYKKSASVELGSATVAVVNKDGKEEILFGPTNVFDAEVIQIETTAGQELIPANSVAGRAFLAIPFIGTIAKIFVG